ncbi:serine hydrolase domain-containing protein [Sphingomonas lycopersici]|uniref:Beta-lactamase family protein n=1 Tax=Sphingomonas lycopersici TaxID=2951807 RepID=A0AA41Z772_9SPHN|nr:serine hydrolase [Sphingomonas lycopersici]MCW6533881.1 beta-lactamase family protein [Sphingomonas lycopersici]
MIADRSMRFLAPFLLAGAVAPAAAFAQADVLPDPVIQMREHWLDADISAFNFRHSADMFETRAVPHGDAVRPLAEGAKLTPPAFSSGGVTRSYDDWARRTYTNALIVLRDGKIVFEDYRNRSRASDRFISFSMAKSITSLLIGIALDKGMIKSLDDPAGKYVPELRAGAYGDVSIRHILQMRSGVDYEERYDFGDKPSLAALIHRHAIVLNEERFADRATTITRAAKPGSRFNYATLDTAVLGWVLERATGQSLAAFTAANLWQPAGMEGDAFWIADGAKGVGRELSGMGFNAMLRDYARLGQLMLDDGVRDGKPVLPRGWIRQATSMIPFDQPTPFGGRGYGFQFWQLDDQPGAYSALGLAGQFIYVHPQSRTVIVKLSHFPLPEPPHIMAETLAYFRQLTGR